MTDWSVVGCPAIKSACMCSLPEGHDGPHVCDCKGSWGDRGEIYAWPTGDEDSLISTLLPLPFVPGDLV